MALTEAQRIRRCDAAKKYYRTPKGRAHARAWLWRHRYGVVGFTEDDYNTLLRAQLKCCAICRAPLETPHFDHCHKTKMVRGLLCKPCNVGLGHFKDNPELLVAAAKYLQRAERIHQETV